MIRKILINHWNKFKKRSLYDKGFTFLFIAFLIVYGINDALEEKRLFDEIEKFKEETVGTITRYERNGSSGSITYYEYYVDNRRYEKPAREIKWFNGCLKTKWCIGKKYVVHYSAKNPSNSVINWDKPVE